YERPTHVAALFGRGAAPDAVRLARAQGPPQALLADDAGLTYGLSEFSVVLARAGGAHREEQLRVVLAARALLDPVFALVVTAVHQVPPFPDSCSLPRRRGLPVRGGAREDCQRECTSFAALRLT